MCNLFIAIGLIAGFWVLVGLIYLAIKAYDD